MKDQTTYHGHDAHGALVWIVVPAGQNHSAAWHAALGRTPSPSTSAHQR